MVQLAAKKAAASSKNAFISLKRLFAFSNALIRFLSCWFSSAIFRDSSRLRSPQPISRLPILAFQIQPYSVLTGICSSSAASFADPRFLANLTACSLYSSSYSLFFDIFVSSVFLFFYFIPLWLMCQVLLYRIIARESRCAERKV